MNNKKFIETKVNSEKVFSGKLLHVFTDTVKLPSGGESTREYIKHQGAAVVIPIIDNKILLVKQYRYPTQQIMIELPAGKIDPGEDEITTVKRELGEETGYTSDNIFRLQPIHPCIGYSNEIIHLFLATNLYKSDHEPDPDEEIENLLLPLEDAIEMIYSGKITDSKTVIGLFWTERLLHNRDLQDRFGINL